MSDDRWMNANHVAEQLDVHPETVRRWIKARKNIAYTRIGREARFSQADVDDYLARMRVEPRAA
jgi:excisionase family DNA binding protein